MTNVLFNLRAVGFAADVDQVAGPALKVLQVSCPDKPSLCAACLGPLATGAQFETFRQQKHQGPYYVHAPRRLTACCVPTECVWTMQKVLDVRTGLHMHLECCCGLPHPDTYFVIPKLRSWLALGVRLLSLEKKSQFLHQKASFLSWLRVWIEMHPEPLQQQLLCGTLGTLERNNCQRLEDAWSATTWAAGSDKAIVWDFSNPQGFDRSLLQYWALHREQLFSFCCFSTSQHVSGAGICSPSSLLQQSQRVPLGARFESSHPHWLRSTCGQQSFVVGPAVLSCMLPVPLP